MTSAVSICNRALQAIGTRSTISSLAESSTEARNCNMIFEDTRDELLGMANWNFAKKTALLSLLKSAPGTPTNTAGYDGSGWNSTYPAPPWLYEYAVPTDSVSVRQITSQITTPFTGVPLMSTSNMAYPFVTGGGAPFEVTIDEVEGADTNVILTNQYLAIGVYTKRVTDPNLFGAQFTAALVQALAAKLAMPLTGQVQLMGAKFQEANAIIRVARASDGNEGLTVIDNMPDWITIREGAPAYAGLNYVAPYAPLYSY